MELVIVKTYCTQGNICIHYRSILACCKPILVALWLLFIPTPTGNGGNIPITASLQTSHRVLKIYSHFPDPQSIQLESFSQSESDHTFSAILVTATPWTDRIRKQKIRPYTRSLLTSYGVRSGLSKARPQSIDNLGQATCTHLYKTLHKTM